MVKKHAINKLFKKKFLEQKLLILKKKFKIQIQKNHYNSTIFGKHFQVNFLNALFQYEINK